MGSWSPPEGFLPTIVGPPTADEKRAKRRAEVENALSPIHVSRHKGELSIGVRAGLNGDWTLVLPKAFLSYVLHVVS